ncbi:MAG: cell division topological specificity factor MinE [Schaedlerella sp.]|nr:cell division topological specificity factor MinE [Lachnospiraceae bacterium]MDY4203277.1 cell division topological specificity factor MinE [Schaedlerella sp.]
MSVPSVQIAKERIKSLVIADRMKCTPDTIEKLSSDIYYTVSKYIDVKPEQFHVKITRSDILIKYTGEKN